MYQFRDPIHGFIEVSDLELEIINSSPFQRLRNIRQLATTYLVYHGAEHTRFGHSIGVMHLVSRAFDSVVRKTKNLFSEDPKENETKILWYRQILRLIGLTHDLGHAPFSHASEELFEEGKEHEDYTKSILFETEIADFINKIGEDFKSKYGDQYEISPELIWLIYDGKDIVNEKYIMPDFMFLKSFMDSELDCDKMDYLLRDSLYCGVSYGNYDLERFISTLTVYKTDGILQLAIEKGGLQALEEFVLARYFMFIQVYFHKTRRYLDIKLVDCLRRILPNSKYPSDINEYLKWDDNKVLQVIAESTDEELQKFKCRQIMSCIYESNAHSGKPEQMNFKIITNMLEGEFGELILTDSIDKYAHKLTPVLFARNDDSGKGIIIIDEKTGETQDIMDVSIILSSLIKPISIKRIYAHKSIAKSAVDRIQIIKS